MDPGGDGGDDRTARTGACGSPATRISRVAHGAEPSRANEPWSTRPMPTRSRCWRLPSKLFVSRPPRITPLLRGRRIRPRARVAASPWHAGSRPPNPLTARVAVNHLWGRHFGRAIVPSVNDFGRNGQRPSHPALLDWLAAEFMDRGWSMKAIHRLIVTSATYRQDSKPDIADLAGDPDNIFLWRWAPVAPRPRSYATACSPWPAAWTRGWAVRPSIITGSDVPRRSLYFEHAAEKQMEFLQIFDGAGVTECYRRKESILPQQALALANSDLSLHQARRLARTLSAQVVSDSVSFVNAGVSNRCSPVLRRTPSKKNVSYSSARVPAGPVRASSRLAHRPMPRANRRQPTRSCGAGEPGSRALEPS